MTMTDAAKQCDPPSDGPAGTPVLLADHVSFHYGSGQSAVDNITVPFYAGEMTMIAGPNGSGKSTLLQLLLGHLSPGVGNVTVEGADLRAMHPLDRAALISYVPQTPQVSFAYNVREVVAMGLWARQQRLATQGVGKSDEDRMSQAMWDMDIHALADRTYDQLSTGERQRVALARAMVQDAPIMLLDEPSAALDIWHQLELHHHLTVLAHRDKKAVIWVTHDLNSARAHADRVLVMHEGKLAAYGQPRTVLVPEVLESVYRVRVTVRDDVLVFARPAGRS
jgi:iron complex transport system ATP-binding protein